MPEVRFKIRGDPVSWARAGSEGKKRFTPKKQALYREVVRLEACRHMTDTIPTGELVTMSVLCGVEWPKGKWWKKRKRPGGVPCKFGGGKDGDRVFNLIGDALQKVVYLNDNQIYWGTFRAERVEQGQPGYVSVTVTWQLAD